jgi:hypothetical protein
MLDNWKRKTREYDDLKHWKTEDFDARVRTFKHKLYHSLKPRQDPRVFEARIKSEIDFIILKLMNEAIQKECRNPSDFKGFSSVGEMALSAIPSVMGTAKNDSKSKRFSILE